MQRKIICFVYAVIFDGACIEIPVASLLLTHNNSGLRRWFVSCMLRMVTMCSLLLEDEFDGELDLTAGGGGGNDPGCGTLEQRLWFGWQHCLG
jgi:hypothetical protein